MSEHTVERQGILTVKDGFATIFFERYFSHPPEKIWKAITEPEHLSSPWYLADARIDGHPGGTVDLS